METEGARRGKMTPAQLGIMRQKLWSDKRSEVVFASSPDKDFFKAARSPGMRRIMPIPPWMEDYLNNGWDSPATTGSFAMDILASILEFGNKDEGSKAKRHWFWCRSIKIPAGDPLLGTFIFFSWPEELTASAIAEGMGEGLFAFTMDQIKKKKAEVRGPRLYGLLYGWGYDLAVNVSSGVPTGAFTYPGAYTSPGLNPDEQARLREDSDMLIKILDNAKKANAALPKDQKTSASEPGVLTLKFFKKSP
jgi:hypothetical protein